MPTDPRRWERTMLARIEAGDDSALAAVYDQYSSLVFGIARRLVGPADAVDICQEVFLFVWEQPSKFDPERGTLRGYVAMIARRRSIDLLRRSGRRRAREERVDLGATPPVPNVDEAAVAMMAAERVRDAVGHLPAEQRRAIELAYFDGCTFREVAVAMGTPEGTAKSRLRMGLQRLARELPGWGNDAGGGPWG